MKKITLLFFAVLMSMLLFGCAGNDYDSDEDEEEMLDINDYDEWDEGDSSEGIASMSQYEAESEGGVYVLRNEDEFYPITGCQLHYGAGWICSVDDFAVTRDDDSHVITLNSGDQLVTFDAVSSYEFYSAVDEGYILPIELINVLSSGELEFSGGGSLLPCDYYAWEEIEGESFSDLDEVEAVLQRHGARFFRDGDTDRYICADSEMSLSGGYYSGTTYTESSILMDAKCYSFSETYEIPVIRTKDGYFIIDCSSLESGRYCIYDKPNYKKYLIDIAS